MNKWIGIGRLTRNPELNYTQSQTARCTFTLAIDRPPRNGEKEADFIRIVVWGRQAETSNQYLRQGSQCGIEGEIRTGSYKDKDGKTVYTADVWANRVEFLGGGRSEERAEPQRETKDYSFNDLPDTFQSSMDDIPF